jgi:hypothetical protein
VEFPPEAATAVVVSLDGHVKSAAEGVGDPPGVGTGVGVGVAEGVVPLPEPLPLPPPPHAVNMLAMTRIVRYFLGLSPFIDSSLTTYMG